MQEKSILSGHGRTYYWIGKRDSSFTLVFLPGLSADHHLFDRQTAFFSEKYSVLVWDAPAHGRSRPYTGFSYQHAAEELKQILDTEGIRQAVLVGQSAGGFVSQSFYRQYPEMALGIFAIGTCPYDPWYYSRSDLFWLRQTKWMFNLFPNGILQRSMAKMCGSTKPAEENMLKMLEPYSKKELCSLLYAGFAGFIPEMRYIDIQCSVWLTVGEYDKTGKVMHYNKMWHEKEGFPLYIIEGAAHNANDDQPEKVNALLEAFLQELRAKHEEI
ncbi:MAG: alpha/beta hydrolase [Solobacterium sp.]|nr:alpha/beta hydrolase [Solobacterium sp.]